MKRAILFLLIIFGLLVLGCAEKKPEIREETPTPMPAKTPMPTPTPTPTPEDDLNVTLTDIDQLLNELQELENIDFTI
jgi:hypothetical protein